MRVLPYCVISFPVFFQLERNVYNDGARYFILRKKITPVSWQTFLVSVVCEWMGRGEKERAGLDWRAKKIGLQLFARPLKSSVILLSSFFYLSPPSLPTNSHFFTSFPPPPSLLPAPFPTPSLVSAFHYPVLIRVGSLH